MSDHVLHPDLYGDWECYVERPGRYDPNDPEIRSLISLVAQRKCDQGFHILSPCTAHHWIEDRDGGVYSCWHLKAKTFPANGQPHFWSSLLWDAFETIKAAPRGLSNA